MAQYTIPDAARACRVHPNTVRAWIRTGRIDAEVYGKRYLIDESELIDLMPPASALDELIDRIVDQAPELSDDQITALRVILRPVGR